jgi:hypothetical protein
VLSSIHEVLIGVAGDVNDRYSDTSKLLGGCNPVNCSGKHNVHQDNIRTAGARRVQDSVAGKNAVNCIAFGAQYLLQLFSDDAVVFYNQNAFQGAFSSLALCSSK